jgi:hypothetical protein
MGMGEYRYSADFISGFCIVHKKASKKSDGLFKRPTAGWLDNVYDEKSPRSSGMECKLNIAGPDKCV